MKVYKTKMGELHLVFTEGAIDFRLFQSFVMKQKEVSNDPSLRVMWQDIGNKIKDAPVISENPQEGIISKPIIGQGDIAGKLKVLSQKIDLAIGSIGNISHGKVEIPEIKLDGELMDSLVRRIESSLGDIIATNVEAGTQASSLLRGVHSDVQALVTSVKTIKEDMISISKPTLNVSKHKQVGGVTEATKPEEGFLSLSGSGKSEATITSNGDVIVKAETIIVDGDIATSKPLQDKSKVETSSKDDGVAKQDLNKPSDEKIVVDDKCIRYPWTKGKKRSKPKCFGKFLSLEEDSETPCVSCVWVNDCEQKQTKKKVATEKECFGRHKHDFACSSCVDNLDCLEASALV